MDRIASGVQGADRGAVVGVPDGDHRAGGGGADPTVGADGHARHPLGVEPQWLTRGAYRPERCSARVIGNQHSPPVGTERGADQAARSGLDGTHFAAVRRPDAHGAAVLGRSHGGAVGGRSARSATP